MVDEGLHSEVLPEVVGTRREALRGVRPRAGGTDDEGAIGGSEADLDDDFDDFLLIAVVKFGLLGTVVKTLTGRLREQSEGGQKSDGGDVRAGLGGRKCFCIFVQGAGEGVVVALAKEVGLANRFIGQWGIKGEEWLAKQS